MLKKLRRITSLLLVTALAILAFSSATVNAVIPGNDAYPVNMPAPYPNALRSITGSQASSSLRHCLAKYNINVNNNTLLEVIPSGIEHNTSALLITNVEGSTVTTSYMFALDDNGNVLSVSEPSQGDYSLCDVVGGEEDPFFNESFLCVWAVRYNAMFISSHFCTQPEYAQLIYYNTGGHTVQTVDMQYITNGEEYTYPAGVYLGQNINTHTIHISTNSPRANKYYVSNNAYQTDQAICTDPPGSHEVEFYFVINNKVRYGEVLLPHIISAS